MGKVSDLDALNPRKQTYPVSSVPPVTDDEYNECNTDLRELSNLPVSLSNLTEHAEAFVPPTIAHKNPNYLTSLFNSELEGKDSETVDRECEQILQSLSFSKEDQRAVEITTKEQSSCKEWENQRAGRITGTRIKRVTISNLTKKLTAGDIKFILEICYPELIKFSGNKYTRSAGGNFFSLDELTVRLERCSTYDFFPFC